eukprot:IDg6396t1
MGAVSRVCAHAYNWPYAPPAYTACPAAPAPPAHTACPHFPVFLPSTSAPARQPTSPPAHQPTSPPVRPLAHTACPHHLSACRQPARQPTSAPACRAVPCRAPLHRDAMRRRAAPLFVFLFLVLAVDATCTVEPPYRQIAIVDIALHDHASVYALLNASCELRVLDPERGPLLADGRRRRVLLTRAQLAIARANLPADAFRVIVTDLASLLSGNAAAPDSDIAAVLDHDTPGAYAYAAQPSRAPAAQLPPPSPPSPPHESLDASGAPFASDEALPAGPGAFRSMDMTFYNYFRGADELLARWRLLERRTSKEKPLRVLINGMQHAREWISVMAPTYVAERLAASDASDIVSVLKLVEVIVVPLVNPDGYAYSRNYDRLWRKNRGRRMACNATSRRNGVDLNRNWGIDFGGIASTSTNACEDLFVGSAAFSEPETKSLQKLSKKLPGLKAHLDVHSYGQFVVGPWVHTSDPPRSASTIDRVGKAIAKALSSTGALYRYGRGSDNGLYLASGTATDWFHASGVLSYTIELRPGFPSHFGFH